MGILRREKKMSSYARRMVILGARIFGEMPRPVSSRSQKVIDTYKSEPKKERIGNYYPPLDEFNSLVRRLRRMGIYHDEHMDFTEEMAYIRKLRGNLPVKKGEGKRAKKRK